MSEASKGKRLEYTTFEVGDIAVRRSDESTVRRSDESTVRRSDESTTLIVTAVHRNNAVGEGQITDINVEDGEQHDINVEDGEQHDYSYSYSYAKAKEEIIIVFLLEPLLT